jgi:hypothetical protein
MGTPAVSPDGKPPSSGTAAGITSNSQGAGASGELLTLAASDREIAQLLTVSLVGGTSGPATYNQLQPPAANTDAGSQATRVPVLSLFVQGTGPSGFVGTDASLAGSSVLTDQPPGSRLAGPETFRAGGSSDDAGQIALTGAGPRRSGTADLAALIGMPADRAGGPLANRAPPLIAPELPDTRPQLALAVPSGAAGASEFARISQELSASDPFPADLRRARTSPSAMPGDPAEAGALASRLASDPLWEALDRQAEQRGASDSLLAADRVALMSLVASSGYVLLNTRAGYVLLSLLMSRPLWKQFDPLEVLFAHEKEGKDSDDHEETLLSLVE